MSSGSESDEEYVPGKPEQLSEEESADEETEEQYEKEVEYKTKKRKAADEKNNRKKRKTRNCREEVSEEVETEGDNLSALNPEEEKKREEDLWAKFLEGTDTKPKAKDKEPTAPIAEAKQTNGSQQKDTQQNKSQSKDSKDDAKERERRIFEFAGETIVVENNVIKETIKTVEAPAALKPTLPSRSRGSGGLSNLLGQLNKTNQLSTLEKSKLDWITYKKEKGIEEEIQSHNKGKAGYLERQDFLERADLRQYEIERDLRTSKRSNR